MDRLFDLQKERTIHSGYDFWSTPLLCGSSSFPSLILVGKATREIVTGQRSFQEPKAMVFLSPSHPSIATPMSAILVFFQQGSHAKKLAVTSLSTGVVNHRRQTRHCDLPLPLPPPYHKLPLPQCRRIVASSICRSPIATSSLSHRYHSKMPMTIASLPSRCLLPPLTVSFPSQSSSSHRSSHHHHSPPRCRRAEMVANVAVHRRSPTWLCGG